MSKAKKAAAKKAPLRERIAIQLDDFFGVDLRTMALVRICAALTVLWTLAILYQDLAAFFTDAGIYPREYWLETRRSQYIVSFHVIRGELWWQQFLFGIHAIFALMLLFGYKTRFASVMTWILLVSLMARTPPIVHRGDTLLCLMLLWGALSPWGARFSIDGALNTVKNIPRRVTNFATAGLLLQMPLLYFFSTILKFEHPSWHTNFTAVAYSLSPEYVTAFGQFLTEHQPFFITQVLTVYTLIVEGIGPVLMFLPLLIFTSREVRVRWLSRFRMLGIAGLTALQLGLLATVSVGLFPMASTLAILAALPTSFWDRWGSSERLQKAKGLTIFYDPDCGFCKKMVLLIREFLLPGFVKVLPASDEPELHKRMKKNNSWIIRDSEGNLHERYDGFLTVVGYSPWAFVLRPPLKIFTFIGDPVYRLVASNRPAMGWMTRWLDYGAYHVRTGVICGLASVMLMASTIGGNIDSITEDRLLPREIRQMQRGLRVHQNWRMFVTPFTWSSHFVMHATLRDGSEVDLFGGLGPIDQYSARALTWEQPDPQRSSSIYHNYRWRLYFQDIRRSRSQEDRRYYANYVCRQWNGIHGRENHVMRLRFYRMVQTREWLQRPLLEESEKRFLWRHWCFGRPAGESDGDSNED